VLSTLKLPLLHEIVLPAEQHPASARQLGGFDTQQGGWVHGCVCVWGGVAVGEFCATSSTLSNQAVRRATRSGRNMLGIGGVRLKGGVPPTSAVLHSPPPRAQGVAAALATLAKEGGPIAELVIGAAIAAVADELLTRAGPAARAAVGMPDGWQLPAGPPGQQQAAAAAAADPNAQAVLDRSQKALLLMARVLRTDAKTAMALAGVKLAEAQVQAVRAPGSRTSAQQRQQRHQELAAAQAAAVAAVEAAAPAAGSSALLLESGLQEGELLLARQSILALASAVAPAAAAVVAGAGAPLPPTFAGEGCQALLRTVVLHCAELHTRWLSNGIHVLLQHGWQRGAPLLEAVPPFDTASILQERSSRCSCAAPHNLPPPP
jgi:hypothetical protein